MVLYRSPEYQAVKIYNEDKYQISKCKAKALGLLGLDKKIIFLNQTRLYKYLREV